MWYIRTLPGVLGGFAAAYGTDEIVSAYDRMSVNLPTSTGNPASLRIAENSFDHGKLNAMGLHTHWNQDNCEFPPPPPDSPQCCRAHDA